MTRAERLTAILLVAALGWTAWDVSQIGRQSADVPSMPSAKAPVPVTRSADSYAEVVSRSLFVPWRRADFASARDNHAAVGGYVLRGVMLGVMGESAMFEPVRGGPPLRLHTGSLIGGYRVAAMDADSVTLERDGKLRRLDIDYGVGSSADLVQAPAVPTYSTDVQDDGDAPLPVILQQTEDETGP